MSVLFYLLGGIIFGTGLAISGMTQPEVVMGFLLFEDLGLALVMGMAILVTLPVFQITKRPFLGGQLDRFQATVNLKTLFGSILFGIGWGISGVCPGAAIASLGTLNTPILVAVAGMFLGGYLQGLLSSSPTRSPSP